MVMNQQMLVLVLLNQLVRTNVDEVVVLMILSSNNRFSCVLRSKR